MNQIRAIQALNKREIEAGISPNASWHVDYRDTAFINFGGLPYDLSEGDIITIFSQFGEPVFLKLMRDKETGKSKGFGWLKYEDQRSTDLAVDNLGGAEIGGRMIRVDHARYKMRDDEDPDEFMVGWEDMQIRERKEKGLPSEDESGEEETAPARSLLKEERELQLLIENHDEDDPMKEFLIEEKKKEVEKALRREKRDSERHSRKHKDRSHRSHRSHRSKRDRSEDRHERPRRDESPADRHENEEKDDSRRGRRRDSRDRDSHRHRHREDDRDRERRDRDGDNRDRGRDRERRHRSERDGSEGHPRDRHRDRDHGRRRDKDRSRSRSPRPRRD